MVKDASMNASTELDRRACGAACILASLGGTCGRTTIALEGQVLPPILLLRGDTKGLYFQTDPSERALLK